MRLSQNFDLSGANTLALPAKAQVFARFSSMLELLSLLTKAKAEELPVFMLGDGSNVLLNRDVPGLVLQSAMTNIEVLEQTASSTLVAVDAGLNWHQWVLASIEYGHGLENLALIPGTVGAAPVQNIGAYGVEVCELLEAVEGVELDTLKPVTLSAEQCRFGYRDSIFKQELKRKFIITRVQFRLSQVFRPNLSYGGLQDLAQPSPQELIAAVCQLRESKLPNPVKIPNAGSFFKNPIVSAAAAERLQTQYPALPAYMQPNGQVKLAAGWLIEQAGFKGKWLGNVRMHEHQALVLTSNGQASFADVLALTEAVRAEVHKQFGVWLEVEPQEFVLRS